MAVGTSSKSGLRPFWLVPPLALLGLAALTGCEGPAAPEVETEPAAYETVTLADVPVGVPVDLVSLDEAGRALWLVEGRPVLWDGSATVSLPERYDRVVRGFLGPGGELLVQYRDGDDPDVRHTELWSSGSSVELEGQPMGFTRDGTVYLNGPTEGLVSAWRDGRREPTSLPPGKYISFDGTIFVEEIIWPTPSRWHARCATYRDGEWYVIEGTVLCHVRAFADGGAAIVSLRPLARQGGDIRVVVARGGETLEMTDFVWEDGPAEPRGIRGFDAVNSRGTTVGLYRMNVESYLVLLQKDGVVRDLNTLTPSDGWVLEDAGAVNERGEILALGRNDEGRRAVLLLEPRSP